MNNVLCKRLLINIFTTGQVDFLQDILFETMLSPALYAELL